MDLSNWKNSNPNLKINNSNRLFYNRYLYKLTYNLSKARFIRFFSNRNRLPLFANFNLNATELAACNQFRDVIDEHKKLIKFRVESDTLVIFSNDLDLLHNIAFKELANFSNSLVSITVPKNADTASLLLSGCLISSIGNEYKFRVITRSKYYKDIMTKQNVGNYLRNLGTEVRIGKIFLQHLTNSDKYIHQGYFYCNDKGIVDLINLIDYNLVTKVENIILPN
jgi:hypothetical protein